MARGPTGRLGDAACGHDALVAYLADGTPPPVPLLIPHELLTKGDTE